MKARYSAVLIALFLLAFGPMALDKEVFPPAVASTLMFVWMTVLFLLVTVPLIRSISRDLSHLFGWDDRRR